MVTAVSAPAQPPFEDLFETIDQLTVVEVLALTEAVQERFSLDAEG